MHRKLKLIAPCHPPAVPTLVCPLGSLQSLRIPAPLRWYASICSLQRPVGLANLHWHASLSPLSPVTVVHTESCALGTLLRVLCVTPHSLLRPPQSPLEGTSWPMPAPCAFPFARAARTSASGTECAKSLRFIRKKHDRCSPYSTSVDIRQPRPNARA